MRRSRNGNEPREPYRSAKLKCPSVARPVQSLTKSHLLLHASTPKLVSFSPRCNTVDTFPFTTKFPSLLHQFLPPETRGSSRPVVPRSTRRSRSLASRAQPDLCWEGSLLYIGLIKLSYRTFPLSPFTLDLLLSFQNSLFYYGHFTNFGHRTSYTLVVYALIVAHLTTI